jgi:hypothetical protein
LLKFLTSVARRRLVKLTDLSNRVPRVKTMLEDCHQNTTKSCVFVFKSQKNPNCFITRYSMALTSRPPLSCLHAERQQRWQSLFSTEVVSQGPCNMTRSGEAESARECMLFGPACLRRLVSGDTDLGDMRSGAQSKEALVFHVGWRCGPMANKPPKHIIAVMVWCVEGKGKGVTDLVVKCADVGWWWQIVITVTTSSTETYRRKARCLPLLVRLAREAPNWVMINTTSKSGDTAA